MSRVRRDLAVGLMLGKPEVRAEDTIGGSRSGSSTTPGLWRVQAGAFQRRENAEAFAEKLRAAGFEAWLSRPQES